MDPPDDTYTALNLRTRSPDYDSLDVSLDTWTDKQAFNNLGMSLYDTLHLHTLTLYIVSVSWC